MAKVLLTWRTLLRTFAFVFFFKSSSPHWKHDYHCGPKVPISAIFGLFLFGILSVLKSVKSKSRHLTVKNSFIAVVLSIYRFKSGNRRIDLFVLCKKQFPAFVFLLHSNFRALPTSAFPPLHKLLCLNKTHQKLPTCQAGCKVVFSWTRTSTHLVLFLIGKVFLQSHGRSDVRSWSSRLGASGWMSTDGGALEDKDLLYRRPQPAIKFKREKWIPSLLLQKQCFYLQQQIWPEALGVSAWDVVFSCGSLHSLCAFVIWWHLLIPVWRLVQCFTLRPYAGLH